MSSLNLLDEHSFYGEWWFSDAPDKRFYGELTYSPKSGIKLIIHTHENVEEAFIIKNNIILGELENGKVITLYKIKSQKINISSSDVLRIKKFYSFDFAFIGKHFLTPNELMFTNIYTSFTNLLPFFPENKFINTENSEIKIPFQQNFRKKEIAKFNYGNFKVYFYLSPELEFSIKSPLHRELIFRERIDIKIKFSEPKPFIIDYSIYNYNDFYSVIETLRLFFSFISNQPSYNIYLRSDIGDKKPIDIIAFTPFANVVLTPHYELVFKYSDIQDKFAKILENWFINRINKNLKAIFDIYSDILYYSNILPVSQFLLIVYALEAYHRNKFASQYIPEKDYEEFLKKLRYYICNFPKIPTDLKNHLKEMLKYGNEFSLRKRLKDLFLKNNTFIQQVLLEKADKKYDEFIDKVVKWRNNLSHGNIYVEKDEEFEIKSLFNILKIILTGYILTELGIESSEIKEILKRIIERNSIF
ncbi:MAG: hypothetical protein QXO40_05380 [Candidatus Aenigmatarchaeota archaeon]